MVEQIPSIDELLERIVFNEREIDGIVIEQAKKASHSVLEGDDHELTMITVKNGALSYSEKLNIELVNILKTINFDITIINDDIKLKSYSGTTQGEIIVEEDIKTDISNKLVIVAEDIQDSGATLDYLNNYLKLKNPKKIIFSVFIKRGMGEQKKYSVHVGAYTRSKLWLVGFGMDYYENYRDLPYLGEVKEEYCKK